MKERKEPKTPTSRTSMKITAALAPSKVAPSLPKQMEQARRVETVIDMNEMMTLKRFEKQLRFR